MKETDIATVGHLIIEYRRKVEPLLTFAWAINIKGNRLGGTRGVRQATSYAQELFEFLRDFSNIFAKPNDSLMAGISSFRNTGKEFDIGASFVLIKLIEDRISRILDFTDDKTVRIIHDLTKETSSKIRAILIKE